MKNGIKAMLLLFSLALSINTNTAQAQGWTDVTDNFLQNAHFNDSEGWNGWESIRSYGGGMNQRLNCAEFWNETWDLYQTVTLPAGRYRLKAQAYFRTHIPSNEAKQEYDEGTDAEQLTCYIYAGDVSVAVKNIFAEPRDYEYVSNATNWNRNNSLLTEVDGMYYSNSMESARFLFDEDAFWNELEFTLDEETTLQIGIKSEENYGESWSVFDEFTLEYYGTPTLPVMSIQLSTSSAALAVGKTLNLTATVLPDNATNKQLTWSSSNPAVATVTQNGLVRAVANGSARITATSVSTPSVSASCDILVEAENSYDWVDVTEAYLANPNFDNNSDAGWSFSGGGKDVREECVEVYQQAFDFYTMLTDLPNGRYRISVQAFYRTGANGNQRWQNAQDGNDNVQAQLYGNDTAQPLTNIYSLLSTESGSGGYWRYTDWDSWEYGMSYDDVKTYSYPNDMTSAAWEFSQGQYWQNLEVVVIDGTLRMGIKSPSYTGSAWCIFDSFRLEYMGQVTQPTSISLDETNIAIVMGETHQLTATVKPKDTVFKNVLWSSSDEDIVKVDKNGLVTAMLNAGTAIVTATTYDGKYSATCSVTVTAAAASADQYVINEIMSGNVDQFIDPSFNYGGWIEIYNPTAKVAPLAGFYLSDDATNLKKWHMPATMGVVPAYGYKVIWFDNNGPKNKEQAPFKLDTDGGTIYLSNASGTLLTSQNYPEVVTRASYARMTDGGREWDFTAEPTPGDTNNDSEYTDEQLDRPTTDKLGQLFEGTLNFSVNIPQGATLVYTTDGTVPTLDNGQVSQTGLFSIDETTVFRFRFFQDGFLPSEVTTRSFIYKDREYTLPIISIVTDPKMLYDNTIGCYVRGTNGMRGRGQSSPANWNQEWDRPVNFEYLVDGEEVINQEVTFSTAGGWSRGWAPASFKLKGNKKFATSVSNDPVISHRKTIQYPFFKDKPYIRNRTLQNRNAGNDIEHGEEGRMTDAVMQRIALTSGLDIDGQSAEPVLYLINGQVATYPDRGYNKHSSGYMNLNMREPNNKHYVYANYGWDDEEIDIWEMDVDSGYVQMCGDRQAFEQLYSLSGNASDPMIYEQIRDLLDIDEFIDYMAVQLYVGGTDWPHNNTKAFRNRQDGRFRWILFDMDWAFNAGSNAFSRLDGYYKTAYGFYPLFDVYDDNGNRIDKYYKEVEFVAIFCDLLQNEEFRKQFIDRFCIVGGSVYEPTRAARIINEFAELKKDMLVYDGLPNSMNHAAKLINNLTNREPTMTNAMRNYWRMDLSGASAQPLRLCTSDNAGTIFLNDIEVPEDYFNGHVFLPITLRADVPAGYKFVGWKDMTGTAGGDSQTIFTTASDWDYYDQGSLDYTGWQNVNYRSSSWSTGTAPFGFGSNGKPMSYATTVFDWGSNASQKRTTYYLRKEFTLDQAPSDNDKFTLNFQVDDGMIVWVNGEEAYNFHVESGATYDNYTNQYNNWYVLDDPQTGTATIPASMLHQGTNLIAVEVHNCNGTSSDLWWDASFSIVKATDPDEGVIVSTNAELELEGWESDLMAVYEKMTEAERAEAKIAPIRVNEVSAANSVYVDDYYKKQDWVELYNTTDEDIDIEGMYLTDHEDNPLKWQISKGQSQASTIVPAHGFLVIWCDKAESKRLLHAQFKLAAEGGSVMITAADRSWSDVLRYPAHDGNHTVGRYPNGADSVYVMATPTIEKSNIRTSYMVYADQGKLDTSVEEVFIASNGGMRIFIAGNQLCVRSEETNYANVVIYTTAGTQVLRSSATMTAGEANFGLTPLMPGQTYIARATDEEGNRCSIKFLWK